jgi:hypothetical protein
VVPTFTLTKPVQSFEWEMYSLLYIHIERIYMGGQFNMNSNKNTLYVGVHVRRKLIHNIRKLNQQNVMQDRMDIKLAKIAKLRKMNQIAKTNLYFFSDKDVIFEQKLVMETYYDTKKKQWARAPFPFPDVYYNRRSSRLNKENMVHEIRSTFEKMGIPSINTQHYFNKWHVYQQLRQYKGLQPHLPETRLYKNSSDLKGMFKKSSRLFLKSLDSNNGVGIISVTKKNSTRYEYAHFANSSLKTVTVENFKDLIKEIKSFYKGKPFLIQKAIDIIQFNNRTADIRSEVQRNGQGELEYVAHSIRLGVTRAPITNTRTQSTVYPFDSFFKNKMSYTDNETKKLKEQLEKLLLNIYEKIELSYGAFGEIGIDIGIDKAGYLWFIECNAKPGKNTLWVHDDETIDRAFLNPLEYAKFLAKKTQLKT